MIVVDVNLLLYANIDGFPQHERALAWWDDLLNRGGDIGLAGPAIFGFLRLATNPRVIAPPMAVSDAVERVRGWLARPHVRLLEPTERQLTIAFGLLEQLGTGGNLTTDVQLAAHAMAARGAVHSNDNDFGRFPEVVWVNPLR